MKEIIGNLWDFRMRPQHVLCVTTNGTVKKDGRAVMGRGCAKQATELYPEVDRVLGSLLRKHGNRVHFLQFDLLSFPVKHNWWEDADPALISKSARELGVEAMRMWNTTFILPRPGCGNGRLHWEKVRPLLMGLPENVFVISDNPGRNQ